MHVDFTRHAGGIMNLETVIYLVLPFVTWFVTGCTKFAVNTIRSKGLAFQQIGYGGFPSNHSAIVTAMACMIGLREGIAHPAFGAALTLAFIVIMDANSLRIKVGQHATRINELNQGKDIEPLRERVGHSKVEILGGVGMGILCACVLNALTAYL